jgi:hypothetical protein
MNLLSKVKFINCKKNTRIWSKMLVTLPPEMILFLQSMTHEFHYLRVKWSICKFNRNSLAKIQKLKHLCLVKTLLMSTSYKPSSQARTMPKNLTIKLIKNLSNDLLFWNYTWVRKFFLLKSKILISWMILCSFVLNMKQNL